MASIQNCIKGLQNLKKINFRNRLASFVCNFRADKNNVP